MLSVRIPRWIARSYFKLLPGFLQEQFKDRCQKDGGDLLGYKGLKTLTIKLSEDVLKQVDKFSYLRSTIISKSDFDVESSNRIPRYFCSLGLKLGTKISVYIAIVLPNLCLYRYHIRTPGQFHRKCLIACGTPRC